MYIHNCDGQHNRIEFPGYSCCCPSTDGIIIKKSCCCCWTTGKCPRCTDRSAHDGRAIHTATGRDTSIICRYIVGRGGARISDRFYANNFSDVHTRVERLLDVQLLLFPFWLVDSTDKLLWVVQRDRNEYSNFYWLYLALWSAKHPVL